MSLKNRAIKPYVVLQCAAVMEQKIFDCNSKLAVLDHPTLKHAVFYMTHEGKTLIFLKRYEGMTTL